MFLLGSLAALTHWGGASHSVRSTALLAVVRDAYVHGLGIMLWVCAAIALGSALLALFFLPRRAGANGPAAPTAGAPAGGSAPLTGDTAELGR